MDMKSIVSDIFKTIPARFRGEDAPLGFKTRIGFDIDGIRWTASIDGGICSVSDTLEEDCISVIRTGMEEWVGIASHSIDPVSLFLAKKLTVEGDVEAVLATMALIGPYQSDQVIVKDPSWIVDTLGSYFFSHKL